MTKKIVNSVGKCLSKVEQAYIAGLIDADGAIMALIERHKGKKFRFRVRIVVKLTQKDPFILHWLRGKLLIGKMKKNRTTFDWITRDQREIHILLNNLLPFLKIKRKQATIALKIVDGTITSRKGLLKVARLADTLSINNPRSRERRRNFTAMIEESHSPND